MKFFKFRKKKDKNEEENIQNGQNIKLDIKKNPIMINMLIMAFYIWKRNLENSWMKKLELLNPLRKSTIHIQKSMPYKM
ncbi:hypothetical protein [Clostridium beijerinckii]|uniref:hypothetical protein n=1 Tax=Clostridium beijerinckii TaxID=1520 RepID=UPI001F4BE827|nr:hypothetical protein [Clostridium beijerinckii]NRU48291.1 hypothetical protein [Clostridium beijerinckii]